MIPELSHTDTAAAMASALRDSGCLVIKGVTTADFRQQVVAELDDYLARAEVEDDREVDPDEFYPGNTKRVTALVARSESCRTMLMHPTFRGVIDAALLPNCEHYQLHVSSALVVGPGARKQVLHREDDVYSFFLFQDLIWWLPACGR